MLHLLKYRTLQIVRDYPIMFWAIGFPLILGTFFYFSFGNLGLEDTGESSWDEIPVAVIREDAASVNAKNFLAFLEELDGDTLEIRDVSSETDALTQLKNEEISGIYYVDDTPSLKVGASGINESILSDLLKTYNQNASMMADIAREHPERLPEAMEGFDSYDTVTEETSAQGNSMNPNVQYFFALIAYACLSGVFLSVKATFDGQANLSPLGARRSITPTHKLTLVLLDMLLLIFIHFINILILNLYIVKVLGISLGADIPSLILVNFMGSTIGISLGLAIGCIGKFSMNIKIGISVVLTLLPGFLAGLMMGNMKALIETHCPVINRINPAAVLSDAYYCLGIYNDTERFHRCLIILGIMSVGLIIVAFFGIRRERYDSI